MASYYREVERMKEKQKEEKGFIIPYGWNVGANLLGNPASQITGLPLFLKEEPDIDMDEL